MNLIEVLRTGRDVWACGRFTFTIRGALGNRVQEVGPGRICRNFFLTSVLPGLHETYLLDEVIWEPHVEEEKVTITYEQLNKAFGNTGSVRGAWAELVSKGNN